MESTFLLGISVIEWIGYIASLLILISMSLSSIVRLRVYNLAGAAIFSFYGFYIGSLPVGIMNLIIVLTNIYYLRQLFFKKERFDVIEVQPGESIMKKFIHFHHEDILKFFPDFTYDEKSENLILLVLRDLNIAGVIIGEQAEGNEFQIKLDYVTPKYRDYKLGKYIYSKFSDVFREKGIEKLVCYTEVKKHKKYLEKVGFTRDLKNEAQYCMKLNKKGARLQGHLLH